MVDVEACAVAYAEAVDGVVLDVDVVDGALSEDFGELDEVVWPGKQSQYAQNSRGCQDSLCPPAVASETVPP